MRFGAWLLVAWALAVMPCGGQAAEAEVGVCFVPAEYCRARIIDSIGAARTSIRVQAYGFSDPQILAALTAARARGVDVAVVLDHSNLRGREVGARRMALAGIPVWIDHVTGIAHTKAIVIDGERVISGSYNFTRAAQDRNVEDVLFIDSQPVAARFLANWRLRQSVALPLAAAEQGERSGEATALNDSP